ncbi:hypothetical protein Acr_01g0010980 [Actinidia rufa]|uniref:Uncharacterized protein n=1 Tax=Actinidia rufa TaxID=165716 RepID=A0A7J0E5P3_9ERIC|nr:hypothetical protein Acr_01g0010980 [Actinidia rufa]
MHNDMIDKLLSTIYIPADSQEQQKLAKELLVGCESIEWHPVVAIAGNLHFDKKVDELDKAIAMEARDPAWYGIDTIELDKRRWTNTARTQKTVVAGEELDGTRTSNLNGMRYEVMRLPNSHQTDRSNQCAAQNNDDFISSESDTQLLLIK